MSYSNAWMILKGVPVMLLRNEVRVIRWSRFVNYQAMRNLGELLRAGDAQAYIDAMNNGDIMSGINRANIEGFNLEFMQTPKSLDLTAFAEFGQESILTTPDGLLVDMEQVGKFILDLIPEAVTDGRRRIASRRQDPLRSIPRIIGGMLDGE
ncbi:hypothetical protein LZ30DRAFT_42275 [Colletotrichum cereale]|nr:hypothetical protein LZ30DRAFT_42275 [Colletotrichum cereale]